MSGVSLISVALAGYLGHFLPVGVILTGCGLLIALAGLFGWFAIQEPASAQPGGRPHFASRLFAPRAPAGATEGRKVGTR